MISIVRLIGRDYIFYDYSFPILVISLVDMQTIEVRIFQLVKIPSYYDSVKKEIKVIEFLVYSGQLKDEAHFQKIMMFANEWFRMIATFIVESKYGKKDKNRFFELKKGSTVCIIDDVNDNTIYPCSENNATIQFPWKLNNTDSNSEMKKKVFKCFDYRYDVQRGLLGPSARRSHHK